MKNPSQTQGWNAALAGKIEKIPGDSDGAIRQTDQGDNTSPNLHYAREGDIVELRIMGIGKQHARFGDLQSKLSGLRPASVRHLVAMIAYVKDREPHPACLWGSVQVISLNLICGHVLTPKAAHNEAVKGVPYLGCRILSLRR